MRRETSRVSFLMCPFCVRAPLPHATTVPAPFGGVAKVADFPASSRGPRKGCAHRDADRCSMQRAARIRRLYRLRSSEGRRECAELLERMVDWPGICGRPAEHARCCRTGPAHGALGWPRLKRESGLRDRWPSKLGVTEAEERSIP